MTKVLKFILVATLSMAIPLHVLSQEGFYHFAQEEHPGSRKVCVPDTLSPLTVNLLTSTSSWDGTPLPKYPKGKPELAVIHVTIPPKAVLGWHHHDVMSCGILNSGELTLVKRDTQEEKTFKAGDAIIETVGTVHRGENRGDTPVEITVFYITTHGVPLSVPDM